MFLVNVRRLGLIAFLYAIMAAPAFAANGPGAYPGANGQPFQALQGQVNDLSQRLAQESAALQIQIANLQSQITRNTTDITTLNDLVAALRSELDVVKQQVALNSADIELLKAKDLLFEQLFAAMDAKIAALDLRVTANEGDIASLILMDQTLQQLIAALGTQIANLEARVLANTGDITLLKSQIAGLQSRMTTAEAQIATKQSRITQACPVGSSIREIFSNGTVNCQIDRVASGVGTLVVHQERASVYDSHASPFSWVEVRATCPSGYRLTGGGYAVSNDATIVATNIKDIGETWLVRARGTAILGIGPSLDVQADAYCAKVQ